MYLFWELMDKNRRRPLLTQTFAPVRHHARGSRQDRDGGDHIGVETPTRRKVRDLATKTDGSALGVRDNNSHGRVQEAAHEIGIGFDAAIHKIPIFPRRLVDGHGDAQKRVRVDGVPVRGHQLFDEREARVPCLVHPVAVAEQPGLVPLDALDEAGDILRRADLAEGLVGQVDGAAVQGAVARDDARDEGGGRVRERGRRVQHRRGRVGHFVVRVQDPELAQALLHLRVGDAQHPQQVSEEGAAGLGRSERSRVLVAVDERDRGGEV